MVDGDIRENGGLKHSCAEGSRTIDRQIQKIHKEDDKAIKISRLNLLVLGVLVSGVSFSIQSTEIVTGDFFNVHLYLGTAAVVLSTVVASMAYTSSTFEMGLGAGPIDDLRSGEIDDAEYFEKLGEEYPAWIRDNHRVHRFNANAITWTLIFSIVGFILLMGGVAIGMAAAKGSPVSYGLLGSELVAGLIIGFCIYNSDSVFKILMDIREENT